jgi:hypothetical protein
VKLSLLEIRRRRGILVERARNERVVIGELAASQRKLLGLADAAVALGQFFAAKKHLLIVAAASFAVVQPRRALRWGLRLWDLLYLVRKLRRRLVA